MRLFSQKPVSPRRRQPENDGTPYTASKPFRRNQTLTGSASPDIASSNELDAQLRSPRAHVHHLSKHRRHLFRRFVIVVFAILFLYVLLSQLIATVQVSMINSARLPESRAVMYAKAIDQYLGGHPVERFKPSLSTIQLTNQLEQTYPEIKSVTIYLGSQFGSAQADVVLRKPLARWVIDGKSEYVDDEGVVFDYTTYARPQLEIVDSSGTSSATTDVKLVTTHRFLGFVGQVVGDLERRGYRVQQAEIPPLTLRELSVRVKGIPYYFKLTVDRSAGEQVEDMARVIFYLKHHGLSPSYVDVRVQGKAFYR